MPKQTFFNLPDAKREAILKTAVEEFSKAPYQEINIKNLIHCEVDGILFKSVDACKVVEAIRQVLGGGTYYCAYAEQIRSQMKRMDGNHRGELTLRELDVLKRISEGKNTQEIAEELCVSTNTVDTHRRHLMEKLGARNVADLIMTAISRGIIPIRKC